MAEMTKAEKRAVSKAVATSLRDFNANNNKQWDYGTNWQGINFPDFAKFLYDNLFPKLNETFLINIALGNTFESYAREVDFIGQFTEEYVFMDTVPVGMNISKPEELMLKRNYPLIATKFYREGYEEKLKFTVNNNASRLGWATIGDGIAFAVGKLKHSISQINISQEAKLRGMLVDYATNILQVGTPSRQQVNSQQELLDSVFTSMLNLQNNTHKYNEVRLASGGQIGRYTNTTNLNDIAILTTDDTKSYLLNTRIANTYQVAGIDPTEKIISFEDLGGAWKLSSDVTIANNATVEYMNGYGDYQVAIGDVIPKDSIFTYDISSQAEFATSAVEVKPQTELFAYLYDVNKVRYNRYSKNPIRNFSNYEFDETNHWVKIYYEMRMSPFFNSKLIEGTA